MRETKVIADQIKSNPITSIDFHSKSSADRDHTISGQKKNKIIIRTEEKETILIRGETDAYLECNGNGATICSRDRQTEAQLAGRGPKMGASRSYGHLTVNFLCALVLQYSSSWRISEAI